MDFAVPNPNMRSGSRCRGPAGLCFFESSRIVKEKTVLDVLKSRMERNAVRLSDGADMYADTAKTTKGSGVDRVMAKPGTKRIFPK